MKNIILTLGFIIVSVFNLLAQFHNEKELVNAIKECKTDDELNKFLVRNDFIKNSSDTSKHFYAGRTLTKIFYKNLFGDSANEIIIQIHDTNAYAINIFYHRNGKLKKVPGQIEAYFEKGTEYDEQSFLFYFENIFKENENCIITKFHSDYNRTSSETISIYKITADTIKEKYDFEANYSSYSGVLTYDYTNQTSYEFQLSDNKYPKVLIVKNKFNNEEAKQRNEDAEILSGSITSGITIETITFSDKGVKSDKTSKNQKVSIYINLFDELSNRKELNGNIDSNVNMYITDRFFENYLNDKRQMPDMKIKKGETYYLKCTNAYIKDRFLFVTINDSISGHLKTSEYKLRPAFYELLKPEINPKHLYYFTENYDYSGKSYRNRLVYLSRDTVFPKYETNAINLDDPALVYDIYWYLDKEIQVKISDSFNKRIVLPIDKIATYLKPDSLELFRKTGKDKK